MCALFAETYSGDVFGVWGFVSGRKEASCEESAKVNRWAKGSLVHLSTRCGHVRSRTAASGLLYFCADCNVSWLVRSELHDDDGYRCKECGRVLPRLLLG